eukprot:PITA_05425
MEVLKFLLFYIVASLAAAWSTNHPKWKPYSHSHHRGNGYRNKCPVNSNLLGFNVILSLNSWFKKLNLHCHQWTPTMKGISMLSCRSKSPSRRIHLACSPTGLQIIPITCALHDMVFSAGSTPKNSSALTSLGWHGKVPNCWKFGQCKSLQILDLGWNGFNGSIPAKLSQLQNLCTPDLSYNFELNGEIPCLFGQLKTLRVLDLSNDRIRGGGSIPVELGQLKELRVLDLSRYGIGGCIPVELGHLKEFYENLGVLCK